MKKTICSLILAASCGSAAAVEPQAYFGVGVGRVDFSEAVGPYSFEANPTALSFMVGSQINN